MVKALVASPALLPFQLPFAPGSSGGARPIDPLAPNLAEALGDVDATTARLQAAVQAQAVETTMIQPALQVESTGWSLGVTPFAPAAPVTMPAKKQPSR